MRLDEREIARGIDILTSAGLDARRWADFDDVLVRLVDSAHVGIQGHDKTSDLRVAMIGRRYDPEFIRLYEQEYWQENPWLRGIMRAPLGKAMAGEEFAPREEVEGSRFHAEWLMPQGNLLSGVGMVLYRSDERMLTLSINLRFDRGETEQLRALEAIRIFAPHVKAAFATRRHLTLAAADTARATLEAADPDAALLVLDHRARVVQTNRVADRWLSQGLLRTGANRTLELESTPAREAIEAGLNGSLPQGPVTFLTALSERLLVVRVFPVPRQGDEAHAWMLGPGMPAAIVLVQDRTRPRGGDLASVAAAFGLTPAELSLAEALIAGRTLAEHAQARRISRVTARNQLTSIFSKTGMRRQSELVALLLRLTGPGP